MEVLKSKSFLVIMILLTLIYLLLQIPTQPYYVPSIMEDTEFDLTSSTNLFGQSMTETVEEDWVKSNEGVDELTSGWHGHTGRKCRTPMSFTSHAYVTLLYTDKDSMNIMRLFESLRQLKTVADFIVMTLPRVSEDVKVLLCKSGIKIVEIDYIHWTNLREDRLKEFTKLRVWQLMEYTMLIYLGKHSYLFFCS